MHAIGCWDIMQQNHRLGHTTGKFHSIRLVTAVEPLVRGHRQRDPLLQNVIVFTMTFVTSLVFVVMSSTIIVMLSNAAALNILGGSYYAVMAMAVAGLAISLVLALLSGLRLRHSLSGPSDIPSVQFERASSNTSANQDNISGILSYMDDAERAIYMLIVDAGGSMLQKDIVGLKKYSKAKVTRAIDHLERAELVERLRHGTTNLIVVKGAHENVNEVKRVSP